MVGLLRSAKQDDFFEENKKELSEVGITRSTEKDLSILLIAVNFHRRLKKLEEKLGNDQR